MVDEKQIHQWIKDGTISQAQARKMLADTSQEKTEGKSKKFLGIISIIGAVLIFIGVAWLIAQNWHQIPNLIKIFILLLATVSSFVFGVLARQKKHDGVGRGLITLGALLYTSSVFLIAQIYSTQTSIQGFAWLLFLCWPVIILTAYFLESRENVLVALVTFFIWATTQYAASAMQADEGMIFGFVVLFLSAGALLYGVTVYHQSIKHAFTSLYRFWTAFYFLALFYLLSFQTFLGIMSNFTFEVGAFPFFLILFVGISFFGFMGSSLIATSRQAVSIKEVGSFLGLLGVLFILILLTKFGEGSSSFFGNFGSISTALWLLWLFSNVLFIGFIILMLWYGQRYGSTSIVNLALFVFVLDIITRYIGFWADLSGYFAFSLLAIIGGLLLIVLAVFAKRWKRKLLQLTQPARGRG